MSVLDSTLGSMDVTNMTTFLVGLFHPHSHSYSSYLLGDTLSFIVLELSIKGWDWSSYSFPVGMGPPLFQEQAVV